MSNNKENKVKLIGKVVIELKNGVKIELDRIEAEELRDLLVEYLGENVDIWKEIKKKLDEIKDKQEPIRIPVPYPEPYPVPAHPWHPYWEPWVETKPTWYYSDNTNTLKMHPDTVIKTTTLHLSCKA